MSFFLAGSFFLNADSAPPPHLSSLLTCDMRAHPLKKHECHLSRYYYATNIEGKVIRALFDGRVENAKNAKMQIRLCWLW